MIGQPPGFPTSHRLEFAFLETTAHGVEIHCLGTTHTFRLGARRCKCGKVKRSQVKR